MQQDSLFGEQDVPDPAWQTPGSAEDTTEETEEEPSLAEDQAIDFITGKVVTVRDHSKEAVRQRIAEALFKEHGIARESMARDFPIPVERQGRRKTTKRADIAIFAHGEPHTLANLRRVVVCKPEPNNGRTITKLRTLEQAKADLEELEEILGTESTPEVRYGLWTNGLDFFYLYKESRAVGAKYQPLPYWPQEDESLGNGLAATASTSVRRAEAVMLRTSFRRCHNYVHGNEGLPKDAAFWQFLYLLFAKLYDEHQVRAYNTVPRFYTTPFEPFKDEGRRAIQDRVLNLFEDVKRAYPLFTPRDELTLSPRALAFIVGELAPYDLTGSDLDVKGIAYQELVGTNLRGDRGQYFTPSSAVELMVDILDPQDTEIVLDPACGTGGFLRETLRHLLQRWKREQGTEGRPDTEEQLAEYRRRLSTYAATYLYGADFDPFLVRATQMSIMMLTDNPGHVYHMDSLLFPYGEPPGVAEIKENGPQLGHADIVLTNPPFGTGIKIEEEIVLDQYREGGGIAKSWARDKDTGALNAGEAPVKSMAPEQLFVQRTVDWVKPGGRVGIVLPNGLLSNPGPADEAIRTWILDNCWVLASVELPVEAFIHDAGVNILTTLLFLKKKPAHAKNSEAMRVSAGKAPHDYPVFMAVAEKVGIDRRGNPVYQRHPNGDIVQEEVEELAPDGTRQVRRRKVIDNDLPKIAAAYHAFRAEHPEPGGDTESGAYG